MWFVNIPNAAEYRIGLVWLCLSVSVRISPWVLLRKGRSGSSTLIAIASSLQAFPQLPVDGAVLLPRLKPDRFLILQYRQNQWGISQPLFLSLCVSSYLSIYGWSCNFSQFRWCCGVCRCERERQWEIQNILRKQIIGFSQDKLSSMRGYWCRSRLLK